MAAITCEGFTFKSFVSGVCACLNFGLMLSLLMSMNVMFTDWLNSFGAKRGSTTAVQATCLGVTLGAGLIAGMLERKLGERVSLLLGTALATAGFLAGGFVTSLPALIVCVGVVTGSGFCLIHLCSISTILKRFPQKAGFLSSALNCTSGLLLLCIPLLYRYLSEQYTWRGALILAGGIVLHTAIFSLLLTSPLLQSSTTEPPRNCSSSRDQNVTLGSDVIDRPVATCYQSDVCAEDREELVCFTLSSEPKENPGPGLLVQEQADAAEEHMEDSCWSRFKSNAAFLKEPLYICVLLGAVVSLCTVLTFVLLVLDFAIDKGWSVQDGVFLNFVFQLSGLLSSLLVSLVSLHRRVRSIALLIVAALTGGCGLVIVGQVSSYQLALVAYASLGAGCGAVISLFPAAVLEVTGPGPAYSVALGLLCTMEGTLDAGIGIVTGFLVDMLQSYSLISLVYGIISLATSLLLLVVFLCRRSRSSEV